MDKISIACGQCGVKVKVPPTPDKKYKCPKCQGSIQVPAAEESAPVAPEPAEAPSPATRAVRPTRSKPGRRSSRRPTPEPAKKGGKKGLVIAAVVLLAAGGGGGAWYFLKGKPQPPESPPVAVKPPDTGSTPTDTQSGQPATTTTPKETTAPVETKPPTIPGEPEAAPATSTKPPPAFAFVPADAAALIVIRPAAAIRSAAFKALVAQTGGANPLDGAEQGLGLSPEAIDEIVVALKPAEPGGADPVLLLGVLKASQPLDPEKLLSQAGEKVEAEHSGKKYFTVKTDPATLQGLAPGAPLPAELSVWFSDPKTAVFGHESLLKAAIDGGATPAKLDAALSGVMADLPGDAQFVLATRLEPFQAMLPPPSDPAAGGGLSVPGLDKLKAAALSLVATDGLGLSLIGDCAGDEKAANQMRGTMMMGLMGLQATLAAQKKQRKETPADDPAAKAAIEQQVAGLEGLEGVLKSIKVESTAGRLRAQIAIKGDQIALLVQMANTGNMPLPAPPSIEPPPPNR